MDILKRQIKELLTLQETSNVMYAGVDWRDNGAINEKAALLAECAEVLDELQYKWWKHYDTPIDSDKVHSELIDVLHFGMVKNLRYAPIENVAFNMETYANLPLYKINNKVEARRFVVSLLEDFHWINLFSLFKYVSGDDWFNKMYRAYTVKNALNILRHNNGYSTGGYCRNWNGMTDDKWLAANMHLCTADNFDEIYQWLQEIYVDINC